MVEGAAAKKGPEEVSNEISIQLVSKRTRIGRYELCFQLASGGMGTVFLAKDTLETENEQLVALKRIHPHLAEESKFINMFLDEARLAMQIEHPNVCSVTDFGAAKGAHYLVMPYLMGESLSRVSRRAKRRANKDPVLKTLRPRISAKIVACAAAGLHAAHELTDSTGASLNVVHRDVSPQNIFVSYDGAVHVIDFGVARARDRLSNTRTGEVKGKFSYIAPEQIEGKSVDRRADIWSLGVVLWENITGERLFGHSSLAETVRAVMTAKIPTADKYRPDLDPKLVAIAQRALQRDPNQRFQTADEFRYALESYLADTGGDIPQETMATWMDRVFPKGRTEHEQLKQVALGKADVATLTGTEHEPDQTVSSETTGTAIGGGVAKPRRSLWPLFAALIAFIVGLASFTIWNYQRRPQPHTTALSGPGDDVDDPDSSADSNRKDAGAVARASEDAGPRTDGAVTGGAVAAVTKTPTKTPVKRPAKRGKGTVAIATPGAWAYVYFRGKREGTAPVRITLPAGSQTIQIQPCGKGARIRRTVKVKANQTVRLIHRTKTRCN